MTASFKEAIIAIEDLDARIGQLQADAAGYILREVGGRLRERIAALAQTRLESSRDRYLEGLSEAEMQGSTVRVRLTGAFPVMIEEGASAFDMKNTLLQGAPYKKVRFRSTNVGSFGKTGGPSRPIDYPYRKMLGEREARRIGRRIQKDLRQGTRQIEAGRAPLLREHHSTDLFARMRREVAPTKTGRRSMRGQYVIYRTISKNSKGWLHPGIEARDLFGHAQEQLDEIVQSAVDGFAAGMLE